MARLIVVVLLLAAAGAAVLVTTRSSDGPSGDRYTVELDNAFGVVEGADVKVAGVRAGKVTDMRVDRESKRALIDFEITRQGFGSLRADTFCETRPQSLIGEYFIDCEPGTSEQRLKPGSTIPVERTASTVPIDLVNNIMRRPYRERLRIILSELGGGVGGRADQINEAIRRAVPALRETDRVLAILARQNQVLAELTTDADTVIGDLSENRRNVGRFVTETRQTAAASAERSRDIRASLQRLPTFLRELRPTMASLGAAADAQLPALADLNASAGQLEDLFENIQDFAPASEVSLESLAEASESGRPALRAVRPTVAQLNRMSADVPELAKNLGITLRHLDDRKFAVEKDPRSPGGQGYTGFEALLQYLFDQPMAINIFDANGYMLKVNLFISECSEYQNRDSLKKKLQEDPGFYERCAAILGPNQPGITAPDPTASGQSLDTGHHPPELHSQARDQQRAPEAPRRDEPQQQQQPQPQRRDANPVPRDVVPPAVRERLQDETRKGTREARRRAREIRKRLEETLGIQLPDVPAPQLPAPNLPAPGGAAPTPQLPNAGGATSEAQPLLDFLLAP